MSKVILVTGTSGGLGKAIAEHLSGLGHIVYGASRSAPSSPVSFHQLTMDITSGPDVKNVIDTILLENGRIDVLINNAGLGIAGPLETLEAAMIRSVMNTNISGVINTCQHVLPYMRAQHSGLIINISSIGSEIGLPYRGIYSASKAAVDRITESIRMEMKPYGIAACIVQPGDIRTNINQNRLTNDDNSHGGYRASFERTNRLINEGVGNGMDPAVPARLIASIIKSSRVKRLYRVGSFTERFSVVLKRILPAELFEKLISSHYQV